MNNGIFITKIKKKINEKAFKSFKYITTPSPRGSRSFLNPHFPHPKQPVEVSQQIGYFTNSPLISLLGCLDSASNLS
jgi:hypothetical protein